MRGFGVGVNVCCKFQDENAHEQSEAACLKSLFSGGAQLINDLDVLRGQSHFCWLRRSAHASPADDNEPLDPMQTGQKGKRLQQAHSEDSGDGILPTHLHLACLPSQQQDTSQLDDAPQAISMRCLMQGCSQIPALAQCSL